VDIGASIVNKQKKQLTFLFMLIVFSILLIKVTSYKSKINVERSPAHNSDRPILNSTDDKLAQNQINTLFIHSNKSSLQIKNIIQNEINHIYQFEMDSVKQEVRLESIAKKLTQNELVELKNIVVDSQKDSDSRFIALHFLLLRKVETHDLLKEVFFTPNELLEGNYSAHDARSSLKDLEINLRFLALEQIEKNLIQNSQLNFNLNELSTRNPYIISLARIVVLSRLTTEPLLAKMSLQLLPTDQATK